MLDMVSFMIYAAIKIQGRKELCDHVGAWEVYKLNKGTDKVVNDLYSD